MKITETNLVKQLKKKNSKALEFLVDNYSNLLYKIIYNVLNSYGEKGLIEECLNDVLLSIWNNVNMFSGEQEKFIHWICVVAKYKAIDYQRKVSKDKEIVQIDNFVIVSDFSTEDMLLANERQKELLGYINELSDIDRKIFIMRFFLEVSISEIAEKLGVSRNVVDTRIHRGKKILKEKFKSLEKEEKNNEKYIRAF